MAFKALNIDDYRNLYNGTTGVDRLGEASDQVNDGSAEYLNILLDVKLINNDTRRRILQVLSSDQSAGDVNKRFARALNVNQEEFSKVNNINKNLTLTADQSTLVFAKTVDDMFGDIILAENNNPVPRYFEPLQGYFDKSFISLMNRDLTLYSSLTGTTPFVALGLKPSVDEANNFIVDFYTKVLPVLNADNNLPITTLRSLSDASKSEAVEYIQSRKLVAAGIDSVANFNSLSREIKKNSAKNKVWGGVTGVIGDVVSGVNFFSKNFESRHAESNFERHIKQHVNASGEKPFKDLSFRDFENQSAVERVFKELGVENSVLLSRLLSDNFLNGAFTADYFNSIINKLFASELINKYGLESSTGAEILATINSVRESIEESVDVALSDKPDVVTMSNEIFNEKLEALDTEYKNNAEKRTMDDSREYYAKRRALFAEARKAGVSVRRNTIGKKFKEGIVSTGNLFGETGFLLSDTINSAPVRATARLASGTVRTGFLVFASPFIAFSKVDNWMEKNFWRSIPGRGPLTFSGAASLAYGVMNGTKESDSDRFILKKMSGIYKNPDVKRVQRKNNVKDFRATLISDMLKSNASKTQIESAGTVLDDYILKNGLKFENHERNWKRLQEENEEIQKRIATLESDLQADEAALVLAEGKSTGVMTTVETDTLRPLPANPTVSDYIVAAGAVMRDHRVNGRTADAKLYMGYLNTLSAHLGAENKVASSTALLASAQTNLATNEAKITALRKQYKPISK